MADDDDDMGVGGALLDEIEGEEEDKPKQVRQVYDRPDYWESIWGVWLRRLRELSASEAGLDPTCREAREFKTAFRVPYELFPRLLHAVAPIFTDRTHDVAGRNCVPVELKVLGALKVLAGGNAFSDVAAFSKMSRTTAENSFHHFCEKFSEALWDKWVQLPEGEDLKKVVETYRKCGYPGAMASMDCTHFKWEACPFSEQRIHTGKEGFATVVVEAMCDHSGRIIAATKSYPGSENDKTISVRDESIWRIRNQEPWKSLRFDLFNADGTETEYEGAWIIVDGGYAKVPLLIPPIKTHHTLEEHAWSRRWESIRKDIECLFGRIKGRWRLFKGGILFNKREKIDNAWFTACILHNMLHAYDMLGDMEEDADWVGSAGEVGEGDGKKGVGAAGMEEEEKENPAPGFEQFRQKLVNHFACAWGKNQVLWFKPAHG